MILSSIFIFLLYNSLACLFFLKFIYFLSILFELSLFFFLSINPRKRSSLSLLRRLKHHRKREASKPAWPVVGSARTFFSTISGSGSRCSDPGLQSELIIACRNFGGARSYYTTRPRPCALRSDLLRCSSSILPLPSRRTSWLRFAEDHPTRFPCTGVIGLCV